MSYTPFFTVRCTKAFDERVRLTQDHLADIWLTIEAQGRRKHLFYDGNITSLGAYIDFMEDCAVYAYGVYDHNDTLLTTYFVNNFIGHAAMIHFCFTDAGLPVRKAVGIDSCNFLLRNGELSALIGITPQPFRHAWRFALDVGFEQKAILPRACRLTTASRRIAMADAVVTLCTPETLKPFTLEA